MATERRPSFPCEELDGAPKAFHDRSEVAKSDLWPEQVLVAPTSAGSETLDAKAAEFENRDPGR